MANNEFRDKKHLKESSSPKNQIYILHVLLKSDSYNLRSEMWRYEMWNNCFSNTHRISQLPKFPIKES